MSNGKHKTGDLFYYHRWGYIEYLIYIRPDNYFADGGFFL